MGAIIESRLEQLYGTLQHLMDIHPAHTIPAGICAHDVRCTEMADQISRIIEAAFPPGEAEMFLADEPSILDGRHDAIGGGTLRESVGAALWSLADTRLFPDGLAMVHPAVTATPEASNERWS